MNPPQEGTSSWKVRLDWRWAIIPGAIVYYALYWKTFANFILDIDHCELPLCDFQQFFYPAGQAVLQRAPLPPGFYYSNFAAALFAPLALLPLPVATVLWGIVQVLIAAGLFLITGRMLRGSASRYFFSLLFITSAPLINNFKWGQVSALIVLCVLGAFWLYEKGERSRSAMLLGAAAAIKFYPAVFLLVFIFKRDWKYLLSFLGTTIACLVVIPVLTMGPGRALAEQIGSLRSAAILSSTLALVNTDTQYFASVLARYANLSTASPGFTILVVAGYVLAAAVILMVYKLSASKAQGAVLWAGCLLFLTFPFWIPSAWPHYFVFLPSVQILVFEEIARPGARPRIGFFLLWLLAAFFSSILADQAVRDWFTYVWLGLILLGNLGTLLLAWLFVRRKIGPAVRASA